MTRITNTKASFKVAQPFIVFMNIFFLCSHVKTNALVVACYHRFGAFIPDKLWSPSQSPSKLG